MKRGREGEGRREREPITKGAIDKECVRGRAEKRENCGGDRQRD